MSKWVKELESLRVCLYFLTRALFGSLMYVCNFSLLLFVFILIERAREGKGREGKGKDLSYSLSLYQLR